MNKPGIKNCMARILLLCRRMEFPRSGFLWRVISSSQMILAVDRNPPPEKEKRVWNHYDRYDPNNSFNSMRMLLGKPPVDRWNIGVEYIWDGRFTSLIQSD